MYIPFKRTVAGDLQDRGGVRYGDHLPQIHTCTNTLEIHLRVEQLLQNMY